MITRACEVWTGAPDVTNEPDETENVTYAVPTPSLDYADMWHCELRIGLCLSGGD